MFKNIGMDRDGVMTPLDMFQLEKGLQFFKKRVLKDGIDIFKYDMTEIFKCSKLLKYMFWIRYLKEYFVDLKPRDGCKEYIDQMHAEGKNIYCITAGFKLAGDGFLEFIFRKMFQDWLEKNEIHFDGFDYCSEEFSVRDKVIAGKKRHLDLMLEDKADIVEAFNKENIETICFEALYNKNQYIKGRCKDFDEITLLTNKLEIEQEEYLSTKPFYINGKFMRLFSEKINELSDIDKKMYYHELNKNYIEKKLSKPYDEDKIKIKDSHYLKFYDLIIPFLNFYWGTKHINKENIPYQKGMIYAATHDDSLEQFAAIGAIGRKPICFLVAEKLRPMLRGKLYDYVGAEFIERDNAKDCGRAQLEMEKRLLHNEDIFYYPEGTRKKPEGAIMIPIKEGVINLAKSTGHPIIPLSVYGDYRCKLFRNKLYHVVGEHIFIGPDEDTEEARKRVEDILLNLKLEAMRQYKEDKTKNKIIKTKTK